MKLIALALTLLTFTVAASEIYVCPTMGTKLIKDSEYEYQLKGAFKSLDCSIEYTNFPGTEVDMKVLNCSQVKYYFTQFDENTIVLSKNLVWSKDYYCKKQ